MTQLLKDRLQFIPSPVTELLAAMYRVVNHEQLLARKEHKDHISKEVCDWVEETRKKIPAEMEEDLTTFFNKESYLGITLIPEIIKQGAYDSIPSFLSLLHKLPLEVVFTEFTQSGFGPDREMNDFTNPKEVVDFIEKLNLPREEKWKIAYLIFDGDRTKQRLIDIIQSFYYKFFQEMESLVLTKQTDFIEELQQDIEKGRGQFLGELFSGQGVELEELNKLIIFPSYYLDTGTMILLLNKENISSYVLGIRHLEVIKSNRGDKETLDAIKTLIDERRFQVLQLLKKQPCYGYELAQALGVSNSTISHHISSLIAQRFIRAIRRENKVYYEVNVNEIKQVINQLETMFIDD